MRRRSASQAPNANAFDGLLPFGLKHRQKFRTLSCIVSDALAKEDALECDHLRRAIGDSRQRGFHGLCRIQSPSFSSTTADPGSDRWRFGLFARATGYLAGSARSASLGGRGHRLCTFYFGWQPAFDWNWPKHLQRKC